MTNQKFTELLKEQIPQDSSQQITSEYYISYLLIQKKNSKIF
jgi:hypothetical protein